MLIKGEQIIIGQTSNKQNQLVAGDNISMVVDPVEDKTTINANIDVTNYYNKSEIDTLLDDKQNELVAGSNISLIDDPQTKKTTISATGLNQYVYEYYQGDPIEKTVERTTMSFVIPGENLVGIKIYFNCSHDGATYNIFFNSPVMQRFDPTGQGNEIWWRDIWEQSLKLSDVDISMSWLLTQNYEMSITLNSRLYVTDFEITPIYQQTK